MPSRLLISHITLRGPELRQLYELIRQADGIHYEELQAQLTSAPRSAFGLEESPLREALSFLLIAGLIAQEGASRRKARFRACPLRPDLPFSLLLLYHLQRHEDERQRAPVAIYRHLVAGDTLSITPPDLREAMERGPERALFIWTGEKLHFWSHLAAALGIIRRLERCAELLIVPQPSLLLAALRWAAGPGTDRARLHDLLAVIDEELFACFTRRRQPHRGLAQTLLALHHDGAIQLSHQADAARSLLVGSRRVSDVLLLAPPEVL